MAAIPESKEIRGGARNQYELVSENIEAILQESIIRRRRERLNKPRNGLSLGEVYGVTIVRINAQGGDKSGLGVAALMLIGHAERPLQVGELYHVLAVGLGSPDFDEGNIPLISTW